MHYNMCFIQRNWTLLMKVNNIGDMLDIKRVARAIFTL